MKRILATILALASLVGVANANQVVGKSSSQLMAMMGPITFDTFHSSGAAYTGPCDVSLSTGCAEAYSVSRAMTSAYSGPLFQVYNGTTTTDIGQVGHVADVAALNAACLGSATCVISKVYGQINGNALVALATVTGLSPSACSSTYACAPTVIIDPNNGLPIIATPYPTELYDGSSITGITGGTGPTSVFMYAYNSQYSTCCGAFGIAHLGSATDVAGQDFLPGFGYTTGHTFANCATSTTSCALIDIETFMTNGADYSPNSLQYASYMATTDGSAATNTIKVYWNSSTALYSGSAAATLDPGVYPRIGGGGDLSHVNTVLQEGIISNGQFSATDYTNISGNVSSFYGGRSRASCSSTADLGGYYWAADTGSIHDYSTLAGFVGYALRRLSASYFGPIADLRDSTGTVTTFGPNSTGCGIDAAAATFCAAHSPCTVAKLYNQGTFHPNEIPNVHDTTLDMVQATVASQPTVNFSGLNGLPTMVFSGSQSLCSTNTGGVNGRYTSVAAVVAKRTSGTGAYATVFNLSRDDGGFGFGNTSGSIYSFVSNPFIQGGSYTENKFHSLVIESDASNLNLYGDNTLVSSGADASWGITNSQPLCLGENKGGTTPNFQLTGEVAEAVVLSSFNIGTTPISARSAIFSAQEAAWGTLPSP